MSFLSKIMDTMKLTEGEDDGYFEPDEEYEAAKPVRKNLFNSCNPDTQKTDIDVLKKKGYCVEKMQAVDCFCHTRHVENIALLVRN